MFEPNDSIAAPAVMAPDGIICLFTGDDDYYAITLAAGDSWMSALFRFFLEGIVQSELVDASGAVSDSDIFFVRRHYLLP